MPVSTGLQGEPRAKRCKLCDESNHRSESGSGYWQLQLDRDLVDTISAIYPEWFKDNMAEGGGGGGGGGGSGASASPNRESPPKAIIDTSPISMDQNKESLKVKLLLRRPFDQLVAQGIMPPHKTPAAYHGQRRQLERAKTGDMLKAKIQQRPPRQELERRHILEADTSHADPSLAERQRMLKKARLADQLNDQLSHRPGPLELIQKNILHTEESIEEAVKTGRIPYKATSEGQLNRPQHPLNYINPEEDSQSSEGDNIVSPGPSDVLETAAKSAGIVVSLIPTEGTVVVTTATPMLNKDNSEIVFTDFGRALLSSPASLVSSTSTLSPLSSIASPVPSVVSQPPTPAPVPPPPPPPMAILTPRVPVKSDAPGKDKNRKKSKSKSIPKTRTIKFHEYKGPPSAQKSSSPFGNSGESSYQLLLKQQTMLLQCQVELQHKYPQFILPASQKASVSSNSDSNSSSGQINIQQASPSPSSTFESSTPSSGIIGRLEDMKVSDLKAELKRRSLPVSGSKPQLIERLKPFTGSNISNNDTVNHNPSSVDSSIHSSASMDHSHNSPTYQDLGSPRDYIKEEPAERMDICEPVSPASPPEQYQIQEVQPKTKEDIVREQKRQIEELQRELTLSQLKLQAATRTEPKAQLIALQKHLQARQQQQQQQNIALQMRQLQALQARQAQVNEEQQKIQQQQHVAFQNQKNLAGLVLNGADAALVFNQLIQGKAKVVNGHARTNSLPNFLNSIVTPIITAPQIKAEYIEEVKQQSAPEIKLEFVTEESDNKPPPLYEEATKQINKKNNIKSQIVDDVLEILIKNGELPASAANDPTTPGSAGTKNSEPVYPQNVTNDVNVLTNNSPSNIADTNNTEDPLELDPTELLDSLDNLDNMDFSQLVMELGGGNVNTNDNNNMHNGDIPSLISQNNSNDNCQDIAMDTDDWLESLLPSSENTYNGNNGSMTLSTPPAQDNNDLGYDPLLGIMQDPFDPFNLDEFRSPADLTASLSWDKVDYAA